MANKKTLNIISYCMAKIKKTDNTKVGKDV